jgi:hypothetical protein
LVGLFRFEALRDIVILRDLDDCHFADKMRFTPTYFLQSYESFSIDHIPTGFLPCAGICR